MWMVTEHLPNNRAVVEGIFQWTKPGDLLALKHHNYYGFDGHHQKLGDESSMNMYIYDMHMYLSILYTCCCKNMCLFFFHLCKLFFWFV